jgi:hypothetical protein
MSTVVIVLSGARVLRDRVNCVCDIVVIVYRTERCPWRFGQKLDSREVGNVREELEAEHHLRVEKARGSLWSYSTVVLGPRVGYPLRRGTNED